jgi:hypothetical protein
MSKDIRDEYWFEKFGHPRDNKKIKRLKKLIGIVQAELEIDKSLMVGKDIYWDRGYIAGLEHAITVIQEEE